MSRFIPPPVEVGQAVHWFHGRTETDTPTAALVTAVYESGHLDLACFGAGYNNAHVRLAVRHIDHPDLATGDRGEAGCWRLTPRDLALAALVAEFKPAAAS